MATSSRASRACRWSGDPLWRPTTGSLPPASHSPRVPASRFWSAAAIFYAENGFPVSEQTAAAWANSLKRHLEHPNSRKTFLVDDGRRTPRAGEVFRNPDLAGSLRLIAANGRNGYYKGKTADAIVSIIRENGGTMTVADLAEFEPEWVTPIKTTYRGWEVYEIGPNTQGVAALMMLNLMEQYPLAEYGFHSARALHAMIEAKKLA